jgi:hypothetical protein
MDGIGEEKYKKLSLIKARTNQKGVICAICITEFQISNTG